MPNLPGERDNARNSARCTQARKAMHGLDGQHQDVEESVRMTGDKDKWRKYVHGMAIGQPSDRGRLKNRTEPAQLKRNTSIKSREIEH